MPYVLFAKKGGKLKPITISGSRKSVWSVGTKREAIAGVRSARKMVRRLPQSQRRGYKILMKRV